MKNQRRFVYFGAILAALCLYRVTLVSASEDVEEVYSAMESPGSSRSSGDDADAKPEIRLLSPEAAAKDVADSDGVELVPGAERLKSAADASELIIPRKIDRKVALERPGSSVESREQAVAASRSLASEPIEPARPAPDAAQGAERLEAAPMTDRSSAAEQQAAPSAAIDERAASFHPETLVASSKQPGNTALGLKEEPSSGIKVEPPVPEPSGHVGVQELSLIVSDYGFFPNRIFVTQGIPVKIFLSTPSKTTLCFLQDNWGIRKGVSPGKIEEVSFLPRESGDYRFHCPIKSIQGMITVRETPAPMPPSLRGLAAAHEKPTAGIGNEPKNAQSLRMLIED